MLGNVVWGMIKLEFNGNTKMAAEAGRFKMATENNMVIMKSEDTTGYLILMLELGLDWSRVHWLERWCSDDVMDHSELLPEPSQEKILPYGKIWWMISDRNDDWWMVL